jgi:hypothetical protein
MGSVCETDLSTNISIGKSFRLQLDFFLNVFDMQIVGRSIRFYGRINYQWTNCPKQFLHELSVDELSVDQLSWTNCRYSSKYDRNTR